jgi:hypothetical protein
MVGNSKDNPPDKPEDSMKNASLPRKPKVSRAKKPKTAEADEQEKRPDPLMMIPEPDQSGPMVDPAAPDQELLSKKNEPAPSAVKTVPGASGKRMFLPSGVDRKKGAVIAGVIILIAVAVLAFAGVLHIPAGPLSGGDTVQQAAAMETPTPFIPETTPVPAVESPNIAETNAETISLVPGPTQVPPDNLLVYFQVERDPLTRIVSVQYMGGKGQMGVRDVFVRLTRSDGQVLTETFKPAQVGSGVELQGTEKEDRVEVIVHYFTGDEYKVIDQVFEYKKLF